MLIKNFLLTKSSPELKRGFDPGVDIKGYLELFPGYLVWLDGVYKNRGNLIDPVLSVDRRNEYMFYLRIYVLEGERVPISVKPVYSTLLCEIYTIHNGGFRFILLICNTEIGLFSSILHDVEHKEKPSTSEFTISYIVGYRSDPTVRVYWGWLGKFCWNERRVDQDSCTTVVKTSGCAIGLFNTLPLSRTPVLVPYIGSTSTNTMIRVYFYQYHATMRKVHTLFR